MKIVLLVSAFNGLSQRVWCALRRAGHDAVVQLATDPESMIGAVRRANPDLVLCPYLKDRVPAEIWSHWRTVIIHPGPVGDRGPSSLDWAISEAAEVWGVTALQAVEEMDAGPIWAWRTFAMPATPWRKSALYNERVADAALECVYEVLANAADPTFTPTPLSQAFRAVPDARLRPMMRQADRSFAWQDSTDAIHRKICAADGSPGVRTELAGTEVHLFDASPGGKAGAPPGSLLEQQHGAVRVATGDGSIWIGQLRPVAASPTAGSIKLPAAAVLRQPTRAVPHSYEMSNGADSALGPRREIRYRRDGFVGWLDFSFHNGAMSTSQCLRLLVAWSHAIKQRTSVLVLSGSTEAFSNGIHLNVIEAAVNPADEAWANIKAINALCREIVECAQMTTITAFTGSAGAGGVMLALGADHVVARDGIVLNPYYNIGLYGSELHTSTLPRRVGSELAERLLRDLQPVDAHEAVTLGLIDEVGPRDPDSFRAWLTDYAKQIANDHGPQRPSRRHTGGLPIDVVETRELAEMSRDIFDDRSGFAAARSSFVYKRPVLAARQA